MSGNPEDWWATTLLPSFLIANQIRKTLSCLHGFGNTELLRMLLIQDHTTISPLCSYTESCRLHRMCYTFTGLFVIISPSKMITSHWKQFIKVIFGRLRHSKNIPQYRDKQRTRWTSCPVANLNT